MQASLAVVGCTAAVAAWLMSAGRWWLAAAVLLGSVVPFTLVVIKPGNDYIGGKKRAAKSLPASSAAGCWTSEM